MMRLLQTIQIQRGILTYKGLDDLCGEEVTVVSGMVAKQHLQFSTLFQDDKHATVHHQVYVRA